MLTSEFLFAIPYAKCNMQWDGQISEDQTLSESSVSDQECQGCILSPSLFNIYAEYIMWNAGLDEAQAGIETAGRNINNLRYADDTTLMVESKELKSL